MAVFKSRKTEDKFLFYNLHNIIRIKSDIELELGYFKCEEFSEEADLIVSIVEYKPIDNKRYQRVAYGLYYSEAEKSIISNISIFGMRVSWEIRNILSVGTELRVSKSYIFLSRYFPFFPISSFIGLVALIRMVLQIKLILKNYSFLVGSCAVLNGKNIIFTGTQTSGKTLSIINFVETYGADFMSDDHIIVDNNSFYCYLNPLRLRKFHLHFFSYTTFVDPSEKFKGKIRNQTKGDCDIYFIELSASQFIKEISAAEGVKKLCSLNNRALLHFKERILSFLAYIYGELSLFDLQKKQFEILTDSLKNARFFIISAPNTADYTHMLQKKYTG